MEIDRLKRRILYNCDVTDARYSGMYTVCGLVMRLRDLYKWERGLPPWQEDAPADVLQWIGDKETQWEELMTADYQPLPVNGDTFDAFDAAAVNRRIQPAGLFYGAGYAHSMKPTFFLAQIDQQLMVEGKHVWVLGRELARDLLTLPAFSQDGQVVLRTEAGRMYLWDQISYMSRSGRKALDYALQACGLRDRKPETLVRHLDLLWEAHKNIYIRHEVGEMDDVFFDREIWQRLLADYPHTAVELFSRTLKDLLADTGPRGTLAHIIEHRDHAALGLYMAFKNGITRMLTRPLTCAFDAFTGDPHWDRIADASEATRASVKKHTFQMMAFYNEGRRRADKAFAQTAIEEMMRRLELIK